MVKKTTKDLNMEGGQKMNRQECEDLKQVNDKLKKLNKEDAAKVHANIQGELNKGENKDYLDYIEDVLK